ncbi:MAG: DNA polymerase I [Planctomycetota bacterium]
MTETLYLFDGHFHCFRSFYALPAMYTAAGAPTNVVFGIAKMINAIVRRGPSRLAFAFDTPGPTFRHEMYKEYKATRDAAPTDFKSQLPLVMELLEACQIPVIAIPGYEADDVIATLARQARAAGLAVHIDSKDKDLYQLIDDNTALFSISTGDLFTAAGLREKWGITPAQVRDFLRLTGDSSDNVPGIPGIGPKTATKLLAAYGSVEGILAHIADLTPGQQKALTENKENLEISDRLVRLVDTVPLPKGVEDLMYRPPDLTRLRDLYRRLEFGSLLRELDGPAPDGAPAAAPAGLPPTGDYQLVDTDDKFTAMMAALNAAAICGVDIETTGLDPHTGRILGLSCAVTPCAAWYIAFPGSGHATPLDSPRNMAALKAFLEDASRPKAGQNIKFDLKFMRQAGIRTAGYVFDTMLAAYLLNPGAAGRYNLGALAQKHLDIRMTELTEIAPCDIEGRLDVAATDLGKLTEYAGADADITLRLHGILAPLVEQAGLRKLLEEIEVPLAGILAEMERTGVSLDPAVLQGMSAGLEEELVLLAAQITELAGGEFNFNSPKQLGVILFEKLGLPHQRKTKTGYSTDESVLTALAPLHPLPAKVLDARGVTKLKNTYIDVLPGMVNPVTHRIHPEFNQVGTATGRLSSSNPNLQNIPVRSERSRRVRAAFIVSAPDRCLLTADYSQIELRMLAHQSGDANLTAAFREGLDIHRATAAKLHDRPLEAVTDIMRQEAKAVNFGIIYGQGPFGLAQATGMSRSAAEAFIERYFATFPGIKEFINRTIAAARVAGEVRTILNRRRAVPELLSANKNEQRAGERIAVNTVIQGSAADLIKKAMVDIDRAVARAGLDARCLIQIHDELVFELPAAELAAGEALVRTGMERAMDLAVPLKVNMGHGLTWMELY